MGTTMEKRQKVKWTEDMDNYLRRFWYMKPTDEVCTTLGVTSNEATRRAMTLKMDGKTFNRRDQDIPNIVEGELGIGTVEDKKPRVGRKKLSADQKINNMKERYNLTDDDVDLIKSTYKTDRAELIDMFGKQPVHIIRDIYNLGRSRNEWTSKELDLLKKHYPELGRDCVSFLPRHNRPAIYKKAVECGIVVNSDKLTSVGWTDHEDLILRQNHKTNTPEEIAQMLAGRTVDAIKSRINTLGLNGRKRDNQNTSTSIGQKRPSDPVIQNPQIADSTTLFIESSGARKALVLNKESFKKESCTINDLSPELKDQINKMNKENELLMKNEARKLHGLPPMKQEMQNIADQLKNIPADNIPHITTQESGMSKIGETISTLPSFTTSATYETTIISNDGVEYKVTVQVEKK